MQHDNMFQGSIGGPVMQHDGAVQTGRGYRLQFLGSDKPKEITKKVVFGAIALVVAILLITTLLGGKQPKDFPKEMVLRNAIGQTLEEAAGKVGVKIANMTKTEDGVYRTNKKVKLDGISFDLYFYEEAGKLSGFAYIADYQANARKAAKDIYNTLVNLHIKTFEKYPYYLYRDDNETFEVTRKNLLNQLNNEEFLHVKQTSSFTSSDYQEPIKSFMESLKATYPGKMVLFYADKGATYDAESQRVQLVLSYRIEPEREPLYQ